MMALRQGSGAGSTGPHGRFAGLAWDRVDLSRGVLRLEITKSGRRREVPMRQRVYDVLVSRPGAREGGLWPGGSTRAGFEAAVEAARLAAPFRFHDCRHHFASWFMMRGGSVPALQEILGHASLAMTMRYAHMSPEHLRGEMAKTERSAGGGVGTECVGSGRVYGRTPG